MSGGRGLDYRRTVRRIEALTLAGSRGRDHDEVVSSQRRRLFLALALASYRIGYEVVPVDQIAALAKLSKTSLYEHFGGKEGLLRKAVAEFGRLARPELKAGAGQGWSETVVGGVEALCALIAREPELARSFFVEGTAARIARRGGESADFALVGRLLDHPEADEIGPLTRTATLGGFRAIIAERLARGRSDLVVEAAPDLTYLILNARLGPAGALEAQAKAAARR